MVNNMKNKELSQCCKATLGLSPVVFSDRQKSICSKCGADFIPITIDPMWLIWSNEHDMWWRANERGYTPSRKLAGRYTFEKAKSIVKMANRHYAMSPNEAMVEDVLVEPLNK